MSAVVLWMFMALEPVLAWAPGGHQYRLHTVSSLTAAECQEMASAARAAHAEDVRCQAYLPTSSPFARDIGK